MCTKVICNTCSKPTWEGCGEHIEEALADVPVADRCTCPRGAARPSAFGSRPASTLGSRPGQQTFGGGSAGSW